MPYDFRATNIQTEQIIVMRDDDTLQPSQLAIYPIAAQGTPPNQGEISQPLYDHITASDVFMYVSGAIGGKDTNSKGISVFGGDLHISGNLTIDGTGGGGGGGPVSVVTSPDQTSYLSASNANGIEVVSPQIAFVSDGGSFNVTADGGSVDISVPGGSVAITTAGGDITLAAPSLGQIILSGSNVRIPGTPILSSSALYGLGVTSNGSIGRIPLVTGSSGGGGSGSISYIPTTSNLETPIITGILGDLDITDVPGTALGSTNPFIRFVATSPSGSPTVVVVPFTFPVIPMPDKFELNLQIFTGDNPPVPIQSSLGFMNEDNSKAWQIFHDIPTGSVYEPAMKIIEVASNNVGAQWNWPYISGSNAIDIQAKIKKVSPFAAIPQIKIDCDVGGFESEYGRVHSIAYPLGRTTGSINTDWEGDDFHHPALICIFGTPYVGELNIFFSAEFIY